MVGRIGDDKVANALAELARRNPEEAGQARAAFDSLTFGEGVETVTLYGLQYWLWYLLPTKWWTDLTEHQQLAAALGALFDLLEMPRYAAACTSETTMQVLTAWHQGRDIGFKALERAMNASGVQPPDVEEILTWGRVRGVQENDAFQATAAHLEMAIAVGEFAPGARGWRADAERITGEFLTSPCAPGEQSRLERIHSERMEGWARSRGAARARLTKIIASRIMSPAPVPEEAEIRLAPVRWMLTLAATDDGIPLTANHTLARTVVAEGCRRFDWLTLTGRPRSESDIPEAWTLREFVRQLGAVRRSKRTLVLTPAGKRLATADTATLWSAVTAALIPSDPAEGVAAEVILMLHLTGGPTGYLERCAAVAETMAGEGWHNPASGTPIPANDVGWLMGAIHRRLDLLSLLHRQRGLDDPGDRLTDAGRGAAQAALRSRALRPRTDVGSG
ncbi:hypothetical protein [Microtetraspora malaysiensis]|uniref:hypothetical protein n=1 Tax=Microtetraspora malaysiensis TaxID=161358 RepID=UPI00082B1356|nr:hypothetical protein [Microtetraspora malaysiensis]